MICESCKSKNATVYYNYSINGVNSEIHLCSDCAEKFAFNKGGQSFEGSLFSGLFGDFFGKSSILTPGTRASQGSSYKEKICPSCGMSESELRRGGRFGCKDCYTTFPDTVSAMINKLHISAEYKGKIPEGVCDSVSIARKIEKLKREMQEAVERQDYEEAAKIRDTIKMLTVPDEKNDSVGGVE